MTLDLTNEVQKRVDVAPDGCWNWRLYRTDKGYGKVRTYRDGTMLAHRWAYELLVGPIPEGLTLDHLCRNPGCVNPDHLEPVTQRENNLRSYSRTAMQARQVECIRGHAFDEKNTHVTPKGERQCRACGRQRARKYREAKGAQPRLYRRLDAS